VSILADLLVVFVAALHAWFMALEMIFWRKPLGLKTFKQTREQADATAVLAANQGLYNGFLSAGLLVSLWMGPEVSFSFRVFFLGCVIVAGLYGAYSANRRILWVQAVPAAVALLVVFAALP
jgi:putative membrane protein